MTGHPDAPLNGTQPAFELDDGSGGSCSPGESFHGISLASAWREDWGRAAGSGHSAMVSLADSHAGTGHCEGFARADAHPTALRQQRDYLVAQLRT